MLIFAHRGASKAAPENTLLAIRKALEMGVDAIEIDVHNIEDQVVVLHDRHVERTTNGKGRIQDISFAYLRTLDAGQGQRIPTLWEVMQCIAGKCTLNIELKGITDIEPIIALVDTALLELGFSIDQFLLSSFDHHILLAFKQRRPQWRIGAVSASCPLKYAQFAQQLNAYSVHLDIHTTNQKFVDDAHARQLQVYVYTVDDLAEMDELQAMGVDGVFTNVPDIAINHLRSKSRS
ncbi:glycerophosphodiester phosphodiesterase family protein [Alteromonadaceae bacterium BrNp21-10]|nr:glycerophosphodiester phosphodiesterase family protein [Alteromonadaceae bacterium BrNp21-10]